MTVLKQIVQKKHPYMQTFYKKYVPQKCEKTFSENRISRIFTRISSKENM